MRTHAEALAYMNGARDQSVGRPVANNTRLVRCLVTVDGEQIQTLGVLLHQTIVVAYLSDGRAVLNSAGWHTPTTAQRIDGYSPARVGTVQHFDDSGRRTHKTWAVTTAQPIGRTPERVQKCRTCKGTGQRASYTYGEYRVRADPEAPTTTGDALTDYRRYWEGREWVRYDEPRAHYSECYMCKGSGRSDYGSQPRLAPFVDGVIVDGDGQIVGRADSVPVSMASAPQRRPRRDYHDHHRTYSAAPVAHYVSSDAASVSFSTMSAEAEAEMIAFNAMVRSPRKRPA